MGAPGQETAPAASNTPTTSTTATVMRTRTVASRRRSSAALGIEAIPRAADGLDQLLAERVVELTTEMPDVDLDDVRVALEHEVPHVVEDLPLRHDLADRRSRNSTLARLSRAVSGTSDFFTARTAVRDRIDGADHLRCT